MQYGDEEEGPSSQIKSRWTRDRAKQQPGPSPGKADPCMRSDQLRDININDNSKKAYGIISAPPKERFGITFAPEFHTLFLRSKDETCNEREES